MQADMHSMAGWGLHTKENCASCCQPEETELIAKLPETPSVTSQTAIGHAPMRCILHMQGGCSQAAV